MKNTGKFKMQLRNPDNGTWRTVFKTETPCQQRIIRKSFLWWSWYAVETEFNQSFDDTRETVINMARCQRGDFRITEQIKSFGVTWWVETWRNCAWSDKEQYV